MTDVRWGNEWLHELQLNCSHNTAVAERAVRRSQRKSKTWIELRRMIQEAFQRRLNATAPTTGHQGCATALPFQQNAFGALAANNSDDDSMETVATQMAALTYQSQLTATTATNLSQQMGQYLQTLAHQQDQLHQNQHQMMEQCNRKLNSS